MPTEAAVDEFLLERSGDAGYPPEAARLLQAIVGAYEEAVTARKWATATATGVLMIRVADTEFQNHPDHPGAGRWATP